MYGALLLVGVACGDAAPSSALQHTFVDGAFKRGQHLHACVLAWILAKAHSQTHVSNPCNRRAQACIHTHTHLSARFSMRASQAASVFDHLFLCVFFLLRGSVQAAFFGC